MESTQYLARQVLGYSEAVKALRADRDEALQWIRELLPYAEASLGGTKLREKWRAECRGFLERARC